MKSKLIEIIKKSFLYKIYMKIVKHYRRWVIDLQFPFIYAFHALLPVKPDKVVFIETSHLEITESFKLLYDKLINEYNYDVSCLFQMQTRGTRHEKRKRMRKILRSIATAKYVFMNEGSDQFSRIKYRKETVITQTWHACGAFKKFGFSTAELKFGATREYMLSNPFHHGYNNVTVSSPDIMWAYEEAMGYSHESGVIKPLGVSRTDVFFDSEYLSGAYRQLYEVLPEAKGKKVMLYAPTFRGHLDTAYSPNFLDIGKLYEKFSDEWILLIKHHPHVKKYEPVPREYSSFAFDMTPKMTMNSLLCVADVCITDYSSLVFEYSLLERPMIFLSPDLEDYFDWRGFYYDYYEMTPGPVVKTTEEIVDFVNSLPASFDREKVVAFREKFMASCDGHATERIINTVFEQPEKMKKEK